MTKTLQVLYGDCRERLKQIPSKSVNCCITSPPYWGLREYGGKHEIGWESTSDKYIDNLVSIFREVKRTLLFGTLWLNIGDCYIDKQLQGIPWRLALALQRDGWYIRSDIIWHKSNGFPESITSRPTKNHEYIFLLTRTGSAYTYYASAILEESSTFWNAKRFNTNKGYKSEYARINFSDLMRTRGWNTYHTDVERTKRNKRTVWTITSNNSDQGLHLAAFPDKLVETCLLAGTKEGDMVLDPFAGSGTVGRVANKLNRSAILIEQNLDYVKYIRNNVSFRMERINHDLWRLKCTSPKD
jgi:site-specific DNA-methyltransferase (adenine-specific)